MNQRRHAKAFPLAATLVIVALAICFVTFAVKALMVKYQVVQGGSKIKQLENELAALALSNQALQNKKDVLTSVPVLKQKLEAGLFKGFVEIRDKAVFPVGRSSSVASRPGVPPAGNAVAAATVTIGREGGR